MNVRSLSILLVLGILTTITIVQAGNFNFNMNVDPGVLSLVPGGQGVFTIRLSDTSVPPMGGDITLSVSHDDGAHNIYGVSLEPNPVTLPPGNAGHVGAAVATWTVAAFPDAVPGTIIHVHFRGDPPGVIKDAYANIKIVSPNTTTVRGSSLSTVVLIIMGTFLIIISVLILRKGKK